MAIDMFLKIDGVTGESNDSKLSQQIEVKSFSHSVT
ncbi:MAG: type VI secretion system tube protein Hcp, partial [Planctomycetota bacterium]